MPQNIKGYSHFD